MVKRRKTKKKGTKKRAKKRGSKKAFGGYTISFKGCTHSMEAVFGDKPVSPSDMTKKLWAFVKKHKLAK